MRIVFIGTTKISVGAARTLIDEGNEIIFIEKDEEKIDRLSDELDCGFIHGDGSAPKTLKEVGPEQTDFLFCMTDDDQDNIIAALVGRSLGFDKTIIKIEDFAYEHICAELGLKDIIVPTRTISRYLADMIKGNETSELSNVIRDQGRFYVFTAGDNEDDKKLADLKLPKKVKGVCFYREGRFNIAEDDSTLKPGDEVVLIAHQEELKSLEEKWPENK
jgi:trk system potassium uptake protein TrkA